jgi:hypothetical protein
MAGVAKKTNSVTISRGEFEKLIEKIDYLVNSVRQMQGVLAGDEYHQKGVIQRVEKIEESQCKECQKPRIEVLEKKVSKLENKLLYYTGIAIGGGAVLGLIFKIIIK